MSAFTKIFEPSKIGSVQLSNRIVMAPLTRCRADEKHVPTPMMAKYYGQRATAGLLIAEATMVMENNSAFGGREPGIYSQEQVKAWKRVTDEVHQKGGKIFLQLWHGGRACHPALNNGAIPVAPSAIAIDGETHTPKGKLPNPVPQALSLEEIKKVVDGFRAAAENAKSAGFDGVEVHGANGYLLDQFMRDQSNQRTDIYGGSLENRCRLLLEVCQVVCKVWGSDKVGVRLSPLNSYNSMKDSDPVGLTAYACKELSKMRLAYLHMMRGDFFGLQTGDVMSVARANFDGILMANMGYTASEAETAIANKNFDLIAFGHHFISNPNLVEKLKLGQPLVEPDQSTYYTQNAEGYTDYL
jgi:N-ethylmaleimide reductase